jgi:hypothetical protein
MQPKIVYLEYAYIMNPADTFQMRSQFEKSLSDYFLAIGLEANIISDPNERGRRVLYITKKNPTNVLKASTKPPQAAQLKEVTNV